MYSLFAAAANPSARILAFEPGTRQRARLERNLTLNAELLGDRLTLVTSALSDHAGKAEFHELPGGTSSLNADFRTGTETQVVELARGDDVVADLLAGRRIDLIKIDTETTEPDVLRGLAATIERDRPAIFCEVLAGRTEAALQPLVDGWHYDTWWLGPHGPKRRDAIVGDPTAQFVNWLFLPAGTEPLTS